MNKKLINLYLYLHKNGYMAESYNLIEIIKIAARQLDHVATNRTESSELPEGHFGIEDVDPEKYREKLWPLFHKDIHHAHFKRLKDKYEREGFGEEDAVNLAEEQIKEMTTKAANKSVDSHMSFIPELMSLDPDPNIPIVSPGSGFAHEQAITPDLKWRGLEYQQNLVDMANERNKQLENPSESEQWSVLHDVAPGGKLGDEWQSKIKTIMGEDGRVDTVYAKHACGGLTDGVIYDAVKNNVPKLMLATCCAMRYPEISWRVLEPKDNEGKDLTLSQYEDIAKESKRPGSRGENACSLIDSWRKEYLEENGYKVERGETKFGPYIKAIKL
jgi:hypothetical protein